MNKKTKTGKKSIKKIFSSRKFKYGSSAVVFTVIFVAFILVLNVVLSAVASSIGGMYLDITSKKIYTISDETRKALKDVKGQVEIIFCSDADIIESNERMLPIKRLAENYAAEFSNIKLSYHNALNDPTYFSKYKINENERINETTVIVYCPDNNTSAVCQGYSFYKSSTQNQYFAFDGENKFTTAILSTARPIQLKAGFTIGHNEESIGNLSALLVNNGYEVSHDVDLKKISQDELSTYDLLIVCNPTADFTGVDAKKHDGVNEIEKLDNYLTSSFGNLMVFVNNSTEELPVLQEFLSESWGVNYEPHKTLAEAGSENIAGGSANSQNILGNFTDSTGLDASLSNKSSYAKPLFPAAVPLTTTFTEKDTKTVRVICQTSENAYVLNSQSSDDAFSLTSQPQEKKPNTPLLTMTEHLRIYDSGDKHAYVMVCSSLDFLGVLETAAEAQYSNTNVIKSVLKKMGNANVVPNIEFKVLDESALSVTRQQSDNVWKMLVIPIPVIIGVGGLIVFFKRKHS